MNTSKAVQSSDIVDQLAFSQPLADIARSRRTIGRSGKIFEGISALSTPNNLVTIRQLMMEFKPARTLEVGLSFGGSCLVFTSSHRDLGRAPEQQHVAIDPFQATVWDDAGLMIVKNSGLSGFLDFRAQFSSIELPHLLNGGGTFGLIYVDGSHLFEDVFIDAYFTTRLLETGGVVTFDDSADPHVAKVVAFLRTNCSESLKELDLSAYRADGGKSMKYQLGRRLGKVQMTAFQRVGKIERAWNAPFHRF